MPARHTQPSGPVSYTHLFVAQIDAFLHQKNMYKKGESKIKFEDVQDCLIFVSSSFSTQTSYENQTKKSITNRFIQQAMTEFLRHNLEVYFLEKPDEALKIAQQVLINKQSREHADKTRLGLKNTLTKQLDIANRVQKFVACRSKDLAKHELYIVEGDSARGAGKTKMCIRDRPRAGPAAYPPFHKGGTAGPAAG